MVFIIKPIIGITPSIENDILKLNQSYCAILHRLNAVCIILNYFENISDIIKILDGILLSGGGDICEKFLNEKLHKEANNIYPIRDEFEISLCKQAYKINIPVLGICRGMQILSIADGGSINQHILGHNQSEARNVTTHDVIVDKKSKLFSIVNNEIIPVNSFHHQVVNRVGKNTSISAYSEDGFIEAIENNEQSFRIGVQWHPEALYNKFLEHFKIFDEFVKYSIDFKTKNKVYY